MATIDEQNKQSSGSLNQSDGTKTSGSRLRRLVSFFFSPHTLFLILAIPFGVVFTFFVPPFQVPDENLHFYRAYQISEGHFVPQTQGRLMGGWAPVSVVELQKKFVDMRWAAQGKTNPPEIASHLKTPLHPEKKVFVSEAVIACYSPVPYAATSLVFWVGRGFDCSALQLMYLGRLANLAAWCMLVFLAIRWLPAGKWLFMLLALTPMSLYEAASLSADCLTNALAFLTIAAFLRLYASDSVISFRRLIGVFFLLIAMSLCKNIFFIFTGLFFLLRSRQFGGRGRYWLIFGLLLFANLAAVGYWAYQFNGTPINWNGTADPAQQAQYILSAPLNYAAVLLNTFSVNQGFQPFSIRWIGTFVGWFGWTEVFLGRWHFWQWLALLLLVGLTDGSPKIKLNGGRKTLLLILWMMGVLLTITAVYCTWNPVGADEVKGLQGRYWIPFSPLFFLLFYTRRCGTARWWTGPLLTACTAVSLIMALWCIGIRFY